MIPLFFVAGHASYARWGLYYLRSMKALPDDVYSHFMKGEHTIQLSSTPWSGIWSDVEIECHTIESVKERLGLLGNQQIWKL